MQPWSVQKPPRIGIVDPCYNEEDVLPETVSRLQELLVELIGDRLVTENSYLLFVDDGSKDRTWNTIEHYHEHSTYVYGLKLARNVGHQNALIAGLMLAKNDTDAIISIDADLQDDVTVIRRFILKFHEGYEIVYGVRDDRETDTWFKRNSAQAFYKIMHYLGVDIIYNHADYRLMSQRAVEQLSHYKEVNLFLRGVVPLIGLPSTQVAYRRHERFAGESKYPLRKMLSFAIDGITSFSIRPIRMVTTTGFLFLTLSVLVALYALFTKLYGHTVAGWTSIVMSVWFIGGIQIMCAGLIGEYIGKIYKEVKGRPKYFVEKHLVHEDYEDEDVHQHAMNDGDLYKHRSENEMRFVK